MVLRLLLLIFFVSCTYSSFSQTLFLQKDNVGKAQYEIGDTVTYRLTYQVSTANLHNGIIVDTLPDIFDGASVALLHNASGNVSSTSFDPITRIAQFVLNTPLSPGAAVELNIKAVVDVEGCVTGTFLNTAYLQGDNSGGTPLSPASDTTTIFILGQDPNLERFTHVYESGTADTLFAIDSDCDGARRFVTGVRNNGPLCAKNVQLIDSIPTGLELTKIYTGTNRTVVNPNATFSTIPATMDVIVEYQTNNSGGAWLSAGIANPISLTGTNQELDVSTFGLGATDIITFIRWTFPDLPGYYTFYTPTNSYRYGCCTRNFTQGFEANINLASIGDIIDNCVQATYALNDSTKIITTGKECIAIKSTLPASDDVSLYKNVPNQDDPFLFSFGNCVGGLHYQINYQNNTSFCLDSVTVVDTLPSNLYAIAIHAGTNATYNGSSLGNTPMQVLIEYQTNNSVGAWISIGIANPITLTPTDQVLDVSTFGLAATDTIIAVRWFYEAFPAFAGYYEPIIPATWTFTQQNAIGLDVALANGSAGQTISNCSYVSYAQEGTSIPFNDGKPCTAVTIEAPDLTKFKHFYETAQTTTQGVVETDCGGSPTQRFVVSVRNNSSFCADSVTLVDSIPAGLYVNTIYTGRNYTKPPATSLTPVAMDIIIEYQTNNSGGLWISTGISNPISLTTTAQALDVSTFGLAATDTITVIRWLFPSLPAYYNHYNTASTNTWLSYTRSFSQGYDTNVNFDSIGHQIENCLDATQLIGGNYEPITDGNECVTIQSAIPNADDLKVYKAVPAGTDPYAYYWGQCSGGLRYLVIPRNRSANCMDSVQLIDTLPSNLYATGIYTGTGISRHSNAVNNYSYDVVIEYQTNNSAGAWLSTGIANPITLTTTNQFLDASTFGLGATDTIIAIRWSYEYLPAFSGFYEPIPASLWTETQNNAAGFVAGLSSGNIGDVVRNCANIQYILDGQPMPSTEGDPCTDVTLTAPSVSRYKHKYEDDPKTMDTLGIGSSKRYVLGAFNSSSFCADSVVIMDTIPTELYVTDIYTGSNYTKPPSVSLTPVAMDVIIEYQTNNSGGAWISTGISNPIALATANQTLEVSTFGLAATDTVRAIRWTFPSLPAYYMPYSNFYPSFSWTTYTRQYSQGFSAQIVAGNNGDTICNCITAEHLVYGSIETINQNEYRCSKTELIGSSVQPTKSLLTSSFTTIGDTIRYQLKVKLNEKGGELENPLVVDLIDTTQFDFIQTAGFVGGGAPAPIFSMAGNYQGSGLTGLIWDFSGVSSHTFAPLDSFVIEFELSPKLGVNAGYHFNEFLVESGNSDWPVQTVVNTQQCTTIPIDANDLDNDGSSTDLSCFSNETQVEVTTLAAMVARPYVKGISAVFRPFLDNSPAGDIFTFRLELDNIGQAALQNISLVNILPYIGDLDLGDFNITRNSEFQPTFNGNIQTSAASLVTSYSTVSNICRTVDFTTFLDPPSCASPSWTTVEPALNTVRSLRFDFPGLILKPGERITLDFDMVMPATVPISDTAFNSFGFIAQRSDNGLSLEASGNKVGVISNPDPLPLSLLSFGGEVLERSHQLYWTTATEINVDHFEVQLSSNGIDFYTINKVKATGNNAVAVNHYQLENYDLDKSHPYYYYRLKINDTDGSFAYSAVVVLGQTKGENLIKVYPNPVENKLSVYVWLPSNQRKFMQFTIYNTYGQKLKQRVVKQLAAQVLSWDLEDLEGGLYFLEIENGNGQRWIERFIKH